MAFDQSGYPVAARLRAKEKQHFGLSLRDWLISLGMLLLWTGCASTPPAPLPPPRNLAAEVQEELHRSAAAWNTGNLDAFLAGYADDATFALRDNFLQGRPSIREYYAPLFAPGAARGTLNLDQITVQVLALDIVLVRGIYQNTQGREVLRGATTLVFRHSLNHWLVIHDHTN